MTRLTREQALEKLGLDIVLALENDELVETSRDLSLTHNKGKVELVSRLDATEDGDLCCMYVFVDQDKYDACQSLDELDWETIINETSEYELI